MMDRLSEAAEIVLTPVVLGELHSGFRRGSRRAENERELDAFLSTPRVSMVPMGEETALRYAAILDALRRAGTPVPSNDLWIAASAMEHGLALLTTDDHYLRIPQILVDHQAP